MTVIAVALAPDGKVVMGADSMMCDESGLVTTVRKITRHITDTGDVLIASCGPAAMVGLLRYRLELPAPTGDLDRWAFDVAEQFTALARDATQVDKDGDVDGYALLAVPGRAWSLSDSLAVPIERFEAAGAGAHVATGVLHALTTDTNDVGPLERVHRAIEAACIYCAGCGPPLWIETLDPPVHP